MMTLPARQRRSLGRHRCSYCLRLSLLTVLMLSVTGSVPVGGADVTTDDATRDARNAVEGVLAGGTTCDCTAGDVDADEG
jgi:hypothetical protein